MKLQQFAVFSQELSPYDVKAIENNIVFDDYARALSELKFSQSALWDITSFYTAVVEELRLNSNLTVFANLHSLLSENFTILDGLVSVSEELVLDDIKFADENVFFIEKFSLVVDSLKLSGAFTGTNSAISSVLVVLSFLDLVADVKREGLTDQLTFVSAVNDKLVAYETLLDSLLFTDGEANQFNVVVSDVLNLNASIGSHAVFKSLLTDKINFFVGFKDADEEYLAYVVNTQSLGVSEYENYNFNSFSYPYAASSDGIYEIDNSGTDDGAHINASIKTGLLDFGTSLKKQVPYAYLGITETGRVLFKTVSNNTGVKKERWYEVNSYTDVMDTTRVRMGKGVKAKYWQFEISNTEGEDLSLESMEVLPVVLKRRKQ